MQVHRVLRFLIALLLCDALATATITRAQNADAIVVPLTDPKRPAVVSVSAFLGDIVVRGVSRGDILVRNPDARRNSRTRQAETPPGMRRLTPTSGLQVEERDNEVTIQAPCAAASTRVAVPNPNPNPNPTPLSGPRPPVLPDMPRFDGLTCGGGDAEIDLQIEVPLKTSLQLSTVNGDITIDAVDGVLEINNVNGDIELTNVAGSVVAHSVNGDVEVVLTRANADAPMAFTTLNGNVDVTLPATVKANLKLRTDNGDMFTDFDIPPMATQPAPRGSRQADGRFRVTVERAITTLLNGGGADIELRSFNGNTYLRRGK